MIGPVQIIISRGCVGSGIDAIMAASDGWRANVLIEEQHVRAGDPDAVDQADEKTVEEIPAGRAPRDDRRANHEDRQPEERLDG